MYVYICIISVYPHVDMRICTGVAVVSPARGQQVAPGGGALVAAHQGFLSVTWTIVCADARPECCVSGLPIVSINGALQPAGLPRPPACTLGVLLAL